MAYPLVRLVLSSLLSLSATFPAAGQVDNPSKPKRISIRNIRIEGDSLLSHEDRQRISADTLHREFEDAADAAEEATERTRSVYQNKGYFRCDVEGWSRRVSGSDWYEVIVQVLYEGAQYRLKDITWVGNTVFSAEHLRALIPVASGEVLRRESVAEGLEAMRVAYGEKGYVNFVVFPETIFDDNTHSIALALTLDEGGQFTFAGGVVSGLPSLQMDAVLAAMAESKGRTYTPTFTDEMFEKLRPLLPPCASLERNYAGGLFDEKKHTVSVSLDFENCYEDWLNSNSGVPYANCCPK